MPHEFIKNLLVKHPDGGDAEIKITKKSDSIPKLIERLGLQHSLSQQFFGHSRDNRIFFKGKRILMNRDENCHLLLNELEKGHRKAGCPEYTAS